MLETLLSGSAPLGPPPLLMFSIDPSALAAGATAIVDTSGNGVPITNSGVVVADKGPQAGVKSLYFAANTLKNLRMPSANLDNILIGDFTLEYWWCPEARQSPAAVIAQWQQTANQGGFIDFIPNDGSQSFWWGAYNENLPLVTTAVASTLNVWEHRAVTRKGNLFSLWRNGTLVGTANNTTTRAKLNMDWGIGVYFNGQGTVPQASAGRLNGWLTKVNVYKGAKYDRAFTPT